MAKKNVKENTSADTARDFVDAADVKENFLYRKDGYIISYLRIYSYNLTLKSRAERRVIADNLTANFKDDNKNFVYFTLPREIDLDKYKGTLKKKHSETSDIGTRNIVRIMTMECSELTTSGENYEHQHFIKIWKKSNDGSAESELIERLRDFKEWFGMSGIKTEILEEKEIIKLCNLYGNSLQAGFEITDNAMYIQMAQI